jgi:hypothetical protein
MTPSSAFLLLKELPTSEASTPRPNRHGEWVPQQCPTYGFRRTRRDWPPSTGTVK